MQREKGAFSSVDELETKIDEMRDEMNALITKERSSNNELVAARMELLKVVSDLIFRFLIKSNYYILWLMRFESI